MPVFEELLPVDNGHSDEVLDLLFTLNEWMAFTKLRIHTNTTLCLFKLVTKLLGLQMCQFLERVCSEYDTVELARKEAAQGRRNATMIMMKKTGQATEPTTPGRLTRKLNLNTYKYYSPGDYPSTIR